MKSSFAKKASITLPGDLEKELKKLAKKEKRTLSGIIQEASRYFLDIRNYEEVQRKLALHAMRKGIQDEDKVDEMIHDDRADDSE